MPTLELFPWMRAYGLQGEGFYPLSAATHHHITREAFLALPDEQGEFWRAERELTVWTYCGFPDMNHAWHGRWNESREMIQPCRLPDSRRDWSISRYLHYDPASKTGSRPQHTDQHYSSPEGTIAACRHFLTSALQLILDPEQKHADPVGEIARRLGPVIHFIQDTGAPPHTEKYGELHRRMELIGDPARLARVAIPEYAVRRLGRHPDTMIEELTERLHELSAFARVRAEPVREACVAGDEDARYNLLIPCAVRCAELTSDLLFSVALFARHLGIRASRTTSPIGEDVMRRIPGTPDADCMPEGWAPIYFDLLWNHDRLRYDSDNGGRWILANTPDAGAAWVVAWPEMPRVAPGERWRLTADATSDGDGESSARIAFFSDDTTRLMTAAGRPAGRRGGTSVQVEATAPDGAGRMRVELVSKGNVGEVAFSSCTLCRTG